MGTGDEAEAIVAALRTATYVVRSIASAQRRHPSPPFITSTLQQDAAQARFQQPAHDEHRSAALRGIDLGDEGTVGLITYMRIGPVRISQHAR